MLELLKASWDHLPPLPKKPRLPPGLLNLKARRAWLSIRPEFTYNDHRDKIQRAEARKAKRQLEKDEAWARAVKRKQARADKKQADKDKKAGLKPLASSKKANTPQTVKPKGKPMPTRAATAPPPKVINGWGALGKTPQRPSVARSPTYPTFRVAYTPVQYVRPAAVGHGGRSRPGMPTRPSQQTYRVQQRPSPGQAVRSASHSVPKTSPPRVVRSATQPQLKRR